jgi:hypothetical protein
MTCAAEGGYLAIINSAVEAQTMKDIFAKNPASAIMAQLKDVAGIGTYSLGDINNWYTIHGKTKSYGCSHHCFLK